MARRCRRSSTVGQRRGRDRQCGHRIRHRPHRHAHRRASWCAGRFARQHHRAGDPARTVSGAGGAGDLIPAACDHSPSFRARASARPEIYDPNISSHPHQRLTHADAGSFCHVVAQAEFAGRENHDSRAVLKPAYLVAFSERASHAMTFGPGYPCRNSVSRKCSRTLATSTAAIGTSVTGWPVAVSRVRSTARSFLQNNFSMRLSAIGLTFQVSPETYVTCSTRQSCVRESGDTCSR